MKKLSAALVLAATFSTTALPARADFIGFLTCATACQITYEKDIKDAELKALELDPAYNYVKAIQNITAARLLCIADCSATALPDTPATPAPAPIIEPAPTEPPTVTGPITSLGDSVRRAFEAVAPQI